MQLRLQQYTLYIGKMVYGMENDTICYITKKKSKPEFLQLYDLEPHFFWSYKHSKWL